MTGNNLKFFMGLDLQHNFPTAGLSRCGTTQLVALPLIKRGEKASHFPFVFWEERDLALHHFFLEALSFFSLFFSKHHVLQLLHNTQFPTRNTNSSLEQTLKNCRLKKHKWHLLLCNMPVVTIRNEYICCWIAHSYAIGYPFL